MLKKNLLLLIGLFMLVACNQSKQDNNKQLESYLHSGKSNIMFIQFTKDSLDNIKGNSYEFYISDNLREQANNTSFTGNINKSQISLIYSDNKNIIGTIEDNNLILNLYNDDGTLRTVKFNKSSEKEYNNKLDKLKLENNNKKAEIAKINSENEIKGILNDEMKELKSNINGLNKVNLSLDDMNNAFKEVKEQYNIWKNATEYKDNEYGILEVRIGGVESSFTSVEFTKNRTNDYIKNANTNISKIETLLQSFKDTTGKKFTNEMFYNDLNNAKETIKNKTVEVNNFFKNAENILNDAKKYKLK